MQEGDTVRVIRGEMYDSIGKVLEVRNDIALVRMACLGLDDKLHMVNFRFPTEDVEVVDYDFKKFQKVLKSV